MASVQHLIAVPAHLLFAAMSMPTHADQGGVPFWTSGQFASLAAVPATPGWSLDVTPYYYNGSADKSIAFQHGDTIAGGTKSISALLTLQPGYAAAEKVLGGQPYVSVAFGPGNDRTTVDLVLQRPAIDRSASDSISGGMDLYPFASLSWAKGNDNWMAYVTGDIPVGAYQSSRLSNLGIGHGAIDAGGGYTYLNTTTGREFSAVLGLTYNWENRDTNVKNGIDSHLDWAASQFLSEAWEVGVVGYVYYQLTGDSGSGNKVGAFKSRVAAVGPELGYSFTLNGQAAYLNLRGYREFRAQNRVEGYAIFASLGIPLGSAGK
jgi:hypothetical protein